MTALQVNFFASTEHQRGATLLVLMLFIFLATTSWTLGQINANSARTQLDNKTATAMSLAKETLIGNSAIDNNRPGSLPCPDIDDDGVADGDFGECDALVGRLPWKTLDTPELLDSSGERLWYALSFKLRDHNDSAPINPLQLLELSLDGAPNIPAIIFSPGAPLANQNGRPSTAVIDYLDGSNNDGDNSYAFELPSQTFNDKILPITREDLFRTVNQRVLAEIRGPDDNAAGSPTNGLRHFHAVNGFFPWADSNGDGHGDAGTATGALPHNDLVFLPATTGWLNANHWFPQVTYQRLDADSVRLSIGGSLMNIIPCPGSPCP